MTLDELARPRFTLHARGDSAEVTLGVYGDHQVSNALCAAAVALECGAGIEQVAAALAAAGPVSRHRMQVTTRADGVTVIDDAYNANPDSMRAGLQALAWIAHGSADPTEKRRSWAVLGEMAELGDDAITEHDRIGRLAVRLDVSRLVVVGNGRSMSAMHHGAVLEGTGGSWGDRGAIAVADGDAALALLRAELRPGDVVLVKASNAAGLGALADALAARITSVRAKRATPAHETDPHRRRHRADRVDPVDPRADPALHQAGFRPPDPRGRPASHQTKRGTPVDGRGGDPGRHLGGLPGHAPGRAGVPRRRDVRVGPAGAGSGHRAGRCRIPRRPDQDPQVAQPGVEQDGQGASGRSPPRCCSACWCCSSATAPA